MQPFPYKREFINPDELWENAVNDDLVTIELLELPEDMSGWRSVPRFIKWEFMGEPIALVTSDKCYDRVNRLVDYFSEPARMKAHRKGKLPPIQYYQEQYHRLFAEAQKLQQQEIDEGGPVHDIRHWLRETIYLLGGNIECTTFKISASKAVFQYLGSKIVLDPSAGWGDRLLGAAAAGVLVYHGVDPNPDMKTAYQEMIDFVKEKNSELHYSVTNDDFLKVNITPESYDTVFTSPPFFDYEIYSTDPKQSIYGRSSLKQWTENFFYPYLAKAWKALVKEGYFAIYISDTKEGKYTTNMYNYINNELKGNFLGIIALTDEEKTHGYPIWIWQK
jgi:16S rRNA G966 N2-methylase RsmD